MSEEPTQENVTFEIKKLYLKDLSFESPLAPVVFTRGELEPNMEIQLQVGQTLLDKDSGVYDVVLTITVTAKSDTETLFLIEVLQAGIFEISGVPEEELPFALEIACPNVLLPFAREVISDVATKGGFPQLLINPINFE
ncbi:protein-export chaperone SecB, partial [Pseudomonadota bacterium]